MFSVRPRGILRPPQQHNLLGKFLRRPSQRLPDMQERVTVCILGMVPPKFNMLDGKRRSIMATFNGHLHRRPPPEKRDIEIYLETKKEGIFSYDSTLQDRFLEPFLASYLFAQGRSIRSIILRCSHELLAAHGARLLLRFPVDIPLLHKPESRPAADTYRIILPPLTNMGAPLAPLFDELTRFCDLSLKDDVSEATDVAAGYCHIIIDVSLTAFFYLQRGMYPQVVAQCLTNVIRACVKLRRYDSNRSLDALVPGWRIYMCECAPDERVRVETRLRLLYFNLLFAEKIRDHDAVRWYAQLAQNIAPGHARFRRFRPPEDRSVGRGASLRRRRR
ncbi:hypothetical protein E4U42_000375 [Claviceps africana]|uniref:Uncharacterized protein n=1 Tax=Claviceps africana TaxID=83212 RepID=A0A8K0J044_9HYPO|nr:hypothetical protein E4U42_000375 [Claviceps africana]